MCTIADICRVKVLQPNYFHFASFTKSSFRELSWSWEPYFQCVYYCCITKVGQTQQDLCSAFQDRAIIAKCFEGNVCAAIGCLQVCFQHALSVETRLLRV